MICGSGWCREQSAVDLDSPTSPVYGYCLCALSSLIFVEDPKDFLVVGLGAGTIPKMIKFFYPDAVIDVVEIDEEIYNVAKEFFFFNHGASVTVSIMDGRDFINRQIDQGRKYDVVILDAFNTDYIPERLKTVEFYKEVGEIINEGGVVSCNLVKGNPNYPAHLVTLKKAFDSNMYECLDPFMKHSTAFVHVTDSKFVNEQMEEIFPTARRIQKKEIDESKKAFKDGE